MQLGHGAASSRGFEVEAEHRAGGGGQRLMLGPQVQKRLEGQRQSGCDRAGRATFGHENNKGHYPAPRARINRNYRIRTFQTDFRDTTGKVRHRTAV